MAFNEEQFIRDMLGATGGKVTIEKGILNKSFEEMKEDLEKVFKPREPLFTLTAEEVEIFQQLLISTKKEFYKLKPTFEVAEKIVQIDNILDRINKWQDENNN